MRININVRGANELLKKMNQFPQEVRSTFAAAGREAAEDVVLGTVGLRKYPPAGPGNSPPPPYYIRGRGTQFANRNMGNSEKLGTKFVVEPNVDTVISNNASYAPLVIGDEQQERMGRIGWRKLSDVAKEKTTQIADVYSAWVERTLRRIGL